MSNSNRQLPSSIDRMLLSNKPTIVITPKLKSQIDYLHKKIGEFEWSGELITTEKGSITDLDNWVITAEELFLCDIGSPSYTSYEVGKKAWMPEDISAMYDQYPGLFDGTVKLQHIHSHHSMPAFFSPTDESNLQKRAAVSNYILMLIVNFDGKYVAKVAFTATVQQPEETRIVFTNNPGNTIPDIPIVTKKSGEKLVVLECKIVMEEAAMEATFLDRYDRVKTCTGQSGYSVSGAFSSTNLSQSRIPLQQLFPDNDIDLDSLDTDAFGDKLPEQKPRPHGNKGKQYNTKKRKLLEAGKTSWNPTDVNILVNALIDGFKNNTKDMSFAVTGLRKLQKTFTTAITRENWMTDTKTKLYDVFNEVFPNKTVAEYCKLLEAAKELLEVYETDVIVSSFLQMLDHEMAEVISELSDKIDYQKHFNQA